MGKCKSQNTHNSTNEIAPEYRLKTTYYDNI